MKISVIIPVYNRAEQVKQAIESVLNQSYPPLEVIVIDDGSKESVVGSLESGVINGRKNISELRTQDSGLQIKTIINKKNKGVAAARNLGFKHAKGEWLAFLDSDDFWLPTKLQAQVTFHRQNSNYLISQTDEIWLRNGRRVNPRKYHLKPEGNIFEPSLARCLVTPSAVLLHRKLLDEVGLFDENLPVCEDYDLWLRIACQHKVGLIKEKLVVKTGGHPDQLSQQYWGMDRFRIKSLENLLASGVLTKAQQEATETMLAKKVVIVTNGARKRGNYLLPTPDSRLPTEHQAYERTCE